MQIGCLTGDVGGVHAGIAHAAGREHLQADAGRKTLAVDDVDALHIGRRSACVFVGGGKRAAQVEVDDLRAVGHKLGEVLPVGLRRAGARLGQRLVLVEAIEQHLGRDVDVVQMVAPAKLDMEREAANLVALPLLRREVARAVRADDNVRHGHSLQRG